MEIIKSSTFKNVETEKIVKEQVASIIEDIKINKDQALKKYNLKFDNNSREVIRVSKEEIEEAYKQVDDKYTKENNDNFKTTWSDWIKQNNITPYTSTTELPKN